MTDPKDPAYPPLPAAPGYGPVGPAPSSVIYAVRLMYVGAALGVAYLVVVVTSKSALRTAVAKKDPSFDSHKLDSVVTVSTVSALVVGVIYLMLFVLLALQLPKGRNWARVVTWVINALVIIGGLASLGQPVAGATLVVSLIRAAIGVAIVVLLLQKPSNAFFKPRAVG
jgi:hypothetical protein